MLKVSKIVSLAILSTSLIISSLARPSEARGGESVGRKRNANDYQYRFFISDLAPNTVVAECDSAHNPNTCLFPNVVSDLEIGQPLNSNTKTLRPLNEITIGSENISLFPNEEKAALNPGEDFLFSFPGTTLSFKSTIREVTPTQKPIIKNGAFVLDDEGHPIFEKSTEYDIDYEITDLDGSPVEVIVNSFSTDSLGFSIKVSDLDDGLLISSIDRIFDILENKDKQYQFQPVNGIGDASLEKFTVDSTDIPEPASLLGLMAFSLLGIKFSKND